jgi:uncharacterized coiled-coil protein SlyX
MRFSFLCILCGFVSVSLPARAETIERVLAVVDGRPVLLSEVSLVQRLLTLELRAAVQTTIDERLMDREAARVPQASTTVDEEAAAFRSLVEKLGVEAEVDEAGLRRIARRQLAVLKYIEFRFRPQVRVEDEAVRSAYEVEHGGDPAAPRFDEVEAHLRDRLESARLSTLVEEWVKELRASAAIRLNPLGAAANPLVD